MAEALKSIHANEEPEISITEPLTGGRIPGSGPMHTSFGQPCFHKGEDGEQADEHGDREPSGGLHYTVALYQPGQYDWEQCAAPSCAFEGGRRSISKEVSWIE